MRAMYSCDRSVPITRRRYVGNERAGRGRVRVVRSEEWTMSAAIYSTDVRGFSEAIHFGML
jgi:hypothetical protein